MRVVRIWIDSEHAAYILTDVSTKDINEAVSNHLKDSVDNKIEVTEESLAAYMFQSFPGSVTIIPTEIEDNEIILNW